MKPIEPRQAEDLTWRRVTFAKDQPEYIALPALVDVHGTVRSLWQPTAEERMAILDGACISLELLTFGAPLQPIRIWVEGVDKPVSMERDS